MSGYNANLNVAADFGDLDNNPLTYTADTLPSGTVFDPQVHGHASRQIGEQPLITAFVRA